MIGARVSDGSAGLALAQDGDRPLDATPASLGRLGARDLPDVVALHAVRQLVEGFPGLWLGFECRCQIARNIDRSRLPVDFDLDVDLVSAAQSFYLIVVWNFIR